MLRAPCAASCALYRWSVSYAALAPARSATAVRATSTATCRPIGAASETGQGVTAPCRAASPAPARPTMTRSASRSGPGDRVCRAPGASSAARATTTAGTSTSARRDKAIGPTFQAPPTRTSTMAGSAPTTRARWPSPAHPEDPPHHNLPTSQAPNAARCVAPARNTRSTPRRRVLPATPGQPPGADAAPRDQQPEG